MTVCTPRASARVRTTAIVCGWHPSAIMNIGVVPGGTFATASVRFIASAAAVASSSREALAIGSAVRSATIVWKLSRASSRPCAISGWYGVYAVYQPGVSTMLRWMTWGVKERSEERRVGEEGRSRWGAYHLKKKKRKGHSQNALVLACRRCPATPGTDRAAADGG